MPCRLSSPLFSSNLKLHTMTVSTNNTIRFTANTFEDGGLEVDRTIPEAIKDAFTEEEWEQFCTNIDVLLEPFNQARNNKSCCYCTVVTFFFVIFVGTINRFTMGICSDISLACLFDYFFLVFLLPLTSLTAFVGSWVYFDAAASRYFKTVKKMEAFLLEESTNVDGFTFTLQSKWSKQWFEIFKRATFENNYIECVVSTNDAVLENRSSEESESVASEV